MIVRAYTNIPIRTLMLAAVLTGGCDTDGGKQTDQPATPTPITRTIERGPVRLEVTLNSDEITIADALKLTIEVLADDGVEVEMPQFGDHLSEFTIRDYRKWPASPAGSQRRWKQEYDLDIYLSGEYEIPAITARFTDRRSDDDTAGGTIQSEITSEAIPIKVHSLLEGEFDPTAFRDVKGAVELPVESDWSTVQWVAGLSVAALIFAAVGFLLWRRRGKRQMVPAIPAHRWALEQLDELERRQLPNQGLVHEYYFLLSDIVREYIERRFSLTAPEQTTSEFLESAISSDAFTADQKTMLREFLQSCDLVKFALHEPPEPEITLAFSSAGDFVRQTMNLEQTREEAA